MDRFSALDLIIKNLLAFLVDVLKEFKWQLTLLVLALLFKRAIDKKLGEIGSVAWKSGVIRFRKPGLPKTRASRQLNPTVSLRGTIRSVGRALGARLDMLQPPPPLPVQSTITTPPCGTLRINVFDTVRVGGSASCSGTLS